MARHLPPRASLRFLHEQAKDLLKAHKQGSAEPCRTFRLLHRFSGSSDREILTSKVALHEAQLALAMDHGFRTWGELTSHVRLLRTEPKSAGHESLVRPDSFAETLDTIHEALFWGKDLSLAQRKEAADWLMSRPGGIRKLSREEWKAVCPVFTGESQQSWASAEVVLNHEAYRALILLDVVDPDVHRLLDRGSETLQQILRDRDTGQWVGTYCCPRCTCGVWRHLSVSGMDQAADAARAGMNRLRMRRDGKGRWHRFAFHYALLALVDMSIPSAIEELEYAAPACEHGLKRPAREDIYDKRRRELMQRVLRRVAESE